LSLISTRVLSLRILALFLLLSALWQPCAYCQEGTDLQEPAAQDDLRRSQYQLRLGTEDQLQFYVHIWGQVNKPGLYLVSDGTDVVALVSLAGGPTEGARLNKVSLVRSGRSSHGVVGVDLKKYAAGGDPSKIPVLEPGDTVIVPSTFWQRFMRFGTILSVAALFANVIVYATRN